MSKTIELNVEIDMEDKIVYIGEENSSGVEESYSSVKDIVKHIKNYIEMYHEEEIKRMEIKKNVDFIYEFLKEQNDTGYIDLEKLKYLQDNKFVTPGDTPKELQKRLDELLEKLWTELEDVPFEEDGGIEYLDDNYLDFEIGETSKDDIWHWFDDRHSKGVQYLLYEYEIHYEANENDTLYKCIKDLQNIGDEESPEGFAVGVSQNVRGWKRTAIEWCLSDGDKEDVIKEIKSLNGIEAIKFISDFWYIEIIEDKVMSIEKIEEEEEEMQ